MTPNDVERVYGALAECLDLAGQDKSELFLAKLALLLAHEIGDAARVLELINEAHENLDAADETLCPERDQRPWIPRYARDSTPF